MQLIIGEKYLVTCDGWFTAPNGNSYNAAYGTFLGIFSDKDTLGIKTNVRSTNWYAMIGKMGIAGCRIHYAIRTETVSYDPPVAEVDHEGTRCPTRGAITRIYDADAEGLPE